MGSCRYDHTEESDTGLAWALDPRTGVHMEGDMETRDTQREGGHSRSVAAETGQMQRPPPTTELGRDQEGFFLELQREPGPAYTLTLDF